MSGKFFRSALEFLRRRARDHFQIGHLRQARENFILHAFCEKRVVRIAAEIVERQHRDRFADNSVPAAPAAFRTGYVQRKNNPLENAGANHGDVKSMRASLVALPPQRDRNIFRSLDYLPASPSKRPRDHQRDRKSIITRAMTRRTTQFGISRNGKT